MILHQNKKQYIKLLTLRANKKLVQNHLMSLTSKTVTLKDIHNIAGKASPAFKNDFQELVKEMKKVKGEVSRMGRGVCVKPCVSDSHITVCIPFDNSCITPYQVQLSPHSLMKTIC